MNLTIGRKLRRAIRNRLNRKASDMPSTIVIWAGRSALDGVPIMVVVSNITRRSENVKTGDMVQVAIMRQDMSPQAAWLAGQDGAVCPEACAHRSKQRGGDGTCYVNKARLESTWKAAMRYLKRYGALMADGSYQINPSHLPARLFEGADIRLGMEGDPSAVPLYVWRWLLDGAKKHTGYTANWRNLGPEWAALFMASATNPFTARKAELSGWRVFAGSNSDAMDADYEAMGMQACAADSHGLRCDQCFKCDGTERGSKRPNQFVKFHGAVAAKVRRDVNKVAA
tara:strand:+ start:205 stop:1056 length:852 start_codon:yes stop_codon:yes gene_type:complete